jgi:hypothetical protein
MSRPFTVQGEVSGHGVGTLPATFGGFSLEGTRIHNNWVVQSADPLARLCLQNVVVRRCQHWANAAPGVVFRNVVVEDIRGGAGGARLLLLACVFDNVTLAGSIGGVLFKWRYSFDDTALNSAFLADNTRRYESIDMALDISRARWTIFDALLGVPADLVRRNPETQFILRAEHAQALADRTDIGAWRIVARDLLESGLPDTVVVAGQTGIEVEAAHRMRSEQLLR